MTQVVYEYNNDSKQERLIVFIAGVLLCNK